MFLHTSSSIADTLAQIDAIRRFADHLALPFAWIARATLCVVRPTPDPRPTALRRPAPVRRTVAPHNLAAVDPRRLDDLGLSPSDVRPLADDPWPAHSLVEAETIRIAQRVPFVRPRRR